MNDNCKAHERRIEIDCWLEGGPPYLVSMFNPVVSSEPVISEMFRDRDLAHVAAQRYARIHDITRIYDFTGGAG